MATISEALAVALQHHQAGRLQAAEQIYRQILAVEPHQAEALHLLGVMAHQTGQSEAAVEYISRAIASHGANAAYHNNLGLAFQAQGKLDAAVVCFCRALELKANFAEAHYNLGNAFRTQEKLDEAVACYRRALELKPDYVDAHYNLGNAFQAEGKLDEAVACFRQAVELKPDYAEVHNNLGNALRAQGKLDEAVACFRQALELKPDYAEVHNDLGNALRDQEKLDEAFSCFRRAVELRPCFAEAHYNQGNVYQDQGKLDAAVECYRRALELRPDYSLAFNNLGNVYKDQGKLDEAIACYNQAVRMNPDAAVSHWNRAQAWLQSGDYERGWAEFEWRFQCGIARPRSFPHPLWDGTLLEGRTILLHCEQGFGDALQFVRYAPLVKERGGRVLLECPPRLHRLFGEVAGVDRLLVAGEELPPFDFHAPLMSLPLLFKTTLATIPASVPYLRAEPARVDQWRPRLPRAAFRIGVAWQGSPQYSADRHRSFPVSALAPLAAVAGVQLISLQKENTLDASRREPPCFPLTNLGEALDAEVPFADTAAIMTLLDLVVSADTSTAHLAGALAVPVWLALSTISDWRWLRGRDDSPWYPTLQLFRQRTLGDWQEVFFRMARELERLIEHPRPAAISVPTTPGELLDKLTILAIKSERITEATKLVHIRAEWTALEAVRARSIDDSPAVKELTAALQAVNETIWQAEDDIRICEQKEDFGPRFVEVARSIYRCNDERSRLKRCLNDLLGAPFSEQKAYSSGR